MFVVLLSTLVAISGASSSLGSERQQLPEDIVQSAVFEAGEDGYYCFRIPVLLFTADLTLLAFAEGRGRQSRSCADHGDVHVVMKRSSDFGKTWSNLTVVYSEYPVHTIGIKL